MTKEPSARQMRWARAYVKWSLVIPLAVIAYSVMVGWIPIW
jgi:hypothetical protein